MMLGPLPVRQTTVAGAKLAALAAFLLLAAGLVTMPSGFLFAMETSDQLGVLAFVTHLVAHLSATVGAAAFTFAAIVAFRGVVVILAGARAVASPGWWRVRRAPRLFAISSDAHERAAGRSRSTNQYRTAP